MTTVRFPFTITNGKVVVDTDPGQAAQSKVLFCLSTAVGERVMYPRWGIDIMNANFWLGAKVEFAIQEAVLAAFRNFFPEFEVREVEVLPNTANPTYIVVNVKWGKYGSGVDVLSRVGVQLPGGGEHFQGEGY